MKRALFPVLVVLVAAATVSAGDLDESNVAADAKWLMHLDVDRLRETDLARQFDERIVQEERAQKALDWVRERYGIDLRQDLHGLTAYGRNYAPHEGVLVLHSDYDRKKIIGVVENEPGYKTTKHGDLTVHTWRVAGSDRDRRDRDRKTDKRRIEKRKPDKDVPRKERKQVRKQDWTPENVSMAFYDESTIVLAGGVESVERAVAVLNGKQPSLERDKKSPLARDVPEGTLFRGAAVDLEGLKTRGPGLAPLALFEQIAVSFGEQDSELFLNKKLVAGSPELAVKMAESFEAMWLGLRSKAHPEHEKIAKGLKINQDGRTVTVTWKADTDAVLNVLEDMSRWWK